MHRTAKYFITFTPKYFALAEKILNEMKLYSRQCRAKIAEQNLQNFKTSVSLC